MIAAQEFPPDVLSRTVGSPLAALLPYAQAEVLSKDPRIEELLHSVPASVFENWTDRKTAQRHSFVSKYVEQLFGFTREEWLSTPDFWFSRVHPEDQKEIGGHAEAIFTGRKETSKSISRWSAPPEKPSSTATPHR